MAVVFLLVVPLVLVVVAQEQETQRATLALPILAAVVVARVVERITPAEAQGPTAVLASLSSAIPIRSPLLLVLV